MRILIIEMGGKEPSEALPLAAGAEADAWRLRQRTFPTPVPLPAEAPASRMVVSNGAMGEEEIERLVRRIDELLERSAASDGSDAWVSVVRFGNVVVEPATQSVRVGEHRVVLTSREFRVLMALVRRRGQVMTRVELLNEVWGGNSAISQRNIDQHITRLRHKLEVDPGAPKHILTVLGQGYRFQA
jgi:hypothetical protein